MSDQALVVSTVVLALGLAIVSIIRIWSERTSWWKMAIVDSVLLPLGWFLMAAARPVVGGNFAGVGAIFAFILTVPVAVAVCLGVHGLRQLKRSDAVR